jgi:serine O-acetyltransferase
MNTILQSDLFRYDQLRGISGLRKAMKYPGFRFTYFFRKASTTSKFTPAGILYRILLNKYKYKYGFQIPAGTKIGKGLFIGHFGTIVVNSKAVIGEHCNLSHGITIGQANRGKLMGVPVIGDYVWIGTGAVIVGKITIGSNVLIAPNAYVNFDVPDNAIVIGNPAKIIEKENPTEGYINNILMRN